MTLIYLFFAALGLGLLIFIHELGHYWVARRVGIKVEAFSIGFGRPIVKWMRDGVEWRIGWLIFGGYVKMAGTDKKGDLQPHEIPGGFFAARPIARIQVALAGPAVNLVFAFLLFCLIWGSGGRDKAFSEFTTRVGWVEPQSPLYQEGLRPGDIITSYDGHPYKSWKDHLYASMLGSDVVEVDGFRVNYQADTKTPFSDKVVPYQYTTGERKGTSTLGVMQPTQYLLYKRWPGKTKNSLPPGSALTSSGIAYGDRLFWVDGELIFSSLQLHYLLNQADALLTVERDGKRFLARAPRRPIGDLDFDRMQKGELGDWHYELGLADRPAESLFIPYVISDEGVVEQIARPIDQDLEKELFPTHIYSPLDTPLRVGDRVVAVDGSPVQFGWEILREVQEHRANIIVSRPKGGWPIVPWEQADREFDQNIAWSDLNAIVASIGSEHPVTQAGDFALLHPVRPTTIYALAVAGGDEGVYAAQLKEIEALSDPLQREEAMRLLSEQRTRRALGIELQDRTIRYNPPPTTVFWDVLAEVGRTFKALVTGALHPKWLSGPVGIVQVMHYGWMLGIKEALYWLAVISLNLGVLNLLPIPVLDGGQVCFALWEMITRRRLKAETMERLVIPFVVVLVGFFIFVTYHDLSRLVKGIF